MSTNFYSQFMTKSDVVFDIGANVGDKAAIFSNLVRAVIAVEPQKKCVEDLKKRFLGTNVIVMDKAVGERKCISTLKRSEEMTTTASLSGRFIKDVQASGRFGNRWKAYEYVDVITLDDLVDDYGVPAFIKIDVEGFEPEVVRGLSQPVKALSFEFHPEVLYMTEEVFKHAETLGSFETNYAIGNEFTKLELVAWVQPGDLLKELKKLVGNNSIMGDIYIRWKTQ